MKSQLTLQALTLISFSVFGLRRSTALIAAFSFTQMHAAPNTIYNINQAYLLQCIIIHKPNVSILNLFL
jgi:hypothetical protein